MKFQKKKTLLTYQILGITVNHVNSNTNRFEINAILDLSEIDVSFCGLVRNMRLEYFLFFLRIIHVNGILTFCTTFYVSSRNFRTHRY